MNCKVQGFIGLITESGRLILSGISDGFLWTTIFRWVTTVRRTMFVKESAKRIPLINHIMFSFSPMGVFLPGHHKKCHCFTLSKTPRFTIKKGTATIETKKEKRGRGLKSRTNRIEFSLYHPTSSRARTLGTCIRSTLVSIRLCFFFARTTRSSTKGSTSLVKRKQVKKFPGEFQLEFNGRGP